MWRAVTAPTAGLATAPRNLLGLCAKRRATPFSGPISWEMGDMGGRISTRGAGPGETLTAAPERRKNGGFAKPFNAC